MHADDLVDVRDRVRNVADDLSDLIGFLVDEKKALPPSDRTKANNRLRRIGNALKALNEASDELAKGTRP